MTEGGTLPPVMGGAVAAGCCFSWAFFLAASACWTFFWTTGLLSGEESSSLEETELFDNFCCFWAITFAVTLDLSTSLTDPAAAAASMAALDVVLLPAASELRRRTTFSFPF